MLTGYMYLAINQDVLIVSRSYLMTTTKEPNNIENTTQDDSVELKNVDLDALKQTAEKKPKKNVKQNKNNAKSDEGVNKLQDQITSLQACKEVI